MGGSRFKVLRVKVRQQVGKKGGVEMEEKTYSIPKELLNGKGSEVRDGIRGPRLRVKNHKVDTLKCLPKFTKSFVEQSIIMMVPEIFLH